MERANTPAAARSYPRTAWVVELATGLFWVSSIAGTLGAVAVFSRLFWLPYWLAAPAAIVLGMLFGLLMVILFLSLRGIAERYELAYPGKAQGPPLSGCALVVPYVLVCAITLILFPLLLQSRQPSSGPKYPLVLPIETVYLPFGIALTLGCLAWQSRRTRPLYHAAMVGDTAGVQARLDAGTAADSEDPYAGRTPLIWAIRAGYTATLRALLEHGADPNRRDREGRTPLDWAISTRQVEVVRLLLDHDADPNLAYKPARAQASGDAPSTTTPLIDAVPVPEIVAALLDAGADVNATTPDGLTALIQAAAGAAIYDYGGNEIPRAEAARVLLAHGADVTARDSNGRTALMAAIALGRKDVAEVLRQAGAEA